MKKNPSAAFTLIEIITAISIILVLTGLVLSIAGYATRKGNLSRAAGETAMLAAGLENYKAETGVYPQDFNGTSPGVTDELKTKEHFIPTQTEYEESGEFLYEQLTGDKDRDGVPGSDEKVYLKEFDPRILKADKDATTGRITKVKYFQDPFGYAYGYSTAAAYEEQKYRKDLKDNPGKAERPTGDKMPGFNVSSYDLWSTGGSKPTKQPSEQHTKELEWAKWIKNW